VICVLVQVFLTGVSFSWQQWTLMIRQSGIIADICEGDSSCIESNLNRLFIIAISSEQFASLPNGIVYMKFGCLTIALFGIVTHLIGLIGIILLGLVKVPHTLYFQIAFAALGISTSALNFAAADSANRVQPGYRLVVISGQLAISYFTPFLLCVPLKAMDVLNISYVFTFWTCIIAIPISAIFIYAIVPVNRQYDAKSVVMTGLSSAHQMSLVEIAQSRLLSLNLGSSTGWGSNLASFIKGRGGKDVSLWGSLSNKDGHGFTHRKINTDENNDDSCYKEAVKDTPKFDLSSEGPDWLVDLKPGDCIPNHGISKTELSSTDGEFDSTIKFKETTKIRNLRWLELVLAVMFLYPGFVITNNHYWMRLYDLTNPSFVEKLGWVIGLCATSFGFLAGFLFEINPPISITVFLCGLTVAGGIPHLSVIYGKSCGLWIGGIIASINLSTIFTSRFSYVRTRSTKTYGIWCGLQGSFNGVIMISFDIVRSYMSEQTMERILIQILPCVQIVILIIMFMIQLYEKKDSDNTMIDNQSTDQWGNEQWGSFDDDPIVEHKMLET